MPIDKNTADMVSPFFDLTSMQQKMAADSDTTTNQADDKVLVYNLILVRWVKQKKNISLHNKVGNVLIAPNN